MLNSRRTFQRMIRDLIRLQKGGIGVQKPFSTLFIRMNRWRWRPVQRIGLKMRSHRPESLSFPNFLTGLLTQFLPHLPNLGADLFHQFLILKITQMSQMWELRQFDLIGDRNIALSKSLARTSVSVAFQGEDKSKQVRPLLQAN